jgi:hypothetical protein
MNSMNDIGGVAGPASVQTSHTHRLRRLAGTGFVATLAAMVATTLAAALAHAVGVDFEVPPQAAPRRRDGDDPHLGAEPLRDIASAAVTQRSAALMPSHRSGSGSQRRER